MRLGWPRSGSASGSSSSASAVVRLAVERAAVERLRDEPDERDRVDEPFVLLTMRFEMVSTFLSASFSCFRLAWSSLTESRSPSARAFSMRLVVRRDLVVLGARRGAGQEDVREHRCRLVLAA